jgi:glycosyltransferase involved in cell wall biosynthesis
MKIAVLGTRGIPANYSGFETCVQETAVRLCAHGHEVRVYCRAGKVGDDRSAVKGIELVFLPFLQGKHSETISHTLLSLFHVLVHATGVVHVYGAGNGWCVPLLRLRRAHVVFFVDGLDWERAKWGGLSRAFLRWAAGVGSRFAHHTVADSIHVISVMAGVLKGRKIEYVPYGARLIAGTGEAVLKRLGLDAGEYFLFVGRFVPEKNVHLLVRAFEQVTTRKKLVLVGGNSYDPQYEAKLRSTVSRQILFPGFVFGKEYEELLCSCYSYIQPSALEGTSPSLLAAMGAGACVLVSDIPENKETVADAGFYFSSDNAAHLAEMIEFLDRSPQAVAEKRKSSRDRVRHHYSWDVVSDQILSLSR